MGDKKFEDLTELAPPDNCFESRLHKMSFADLHAMFIFVSGDFNKQFGGRIETRRIIHSRYHTILAELNRRAYDCDPYEASKLEVEGDKPEDIDLSKYEDRKENK
jgi:hypothetical protein